MVDVFISHSSEDSHLAKQLVDLLRSSLNLSARQIRCTSVDGYRLRVGADTDEQLREEVLASRAFVSILSASSLESVYVLFELGARWGARQPLFPLLAPGMNPRSLRGPLTGLNSLSCESAGQLHQLVSDIAEDLGIDTEPPAVYEGDIEALLYSGHSQEEEPPAQEQKRPTTGVDASNANLSGATQAPADDYSEAEDVIRRLCEHQWPDDYNMRSYCMKQQREALALLKQGRPQGIPEEVFHGIRSKCATEWPEDYNMRRYCEKQQLDSYRELEHGPE